MGESSRSLVAHSWRALIESGPASGLDDGPLLERFATREGDAAEAAFAALVARHGPMVRRVCRALLDDPHDADDAFQATFLVLARKARGLRRPDRLASWLYGTAHRASKRLRADAARRRRHEAARPSPISERDPGRSEELRAVLEEVAKLPESRRIAVVLCDLEGLTQDEAARRIGCSDRTLRRRLAHAHDLLRSRLTRRGLAPPAAIFGLAPTPLPESLIDATARGASRFAGKSIAAGVVPASATILANGVIEAMNWTWMMKGIAAAAGGLLALVGGIGVASGFLAGARDEPVKPKPAAKVGAVEPSPQEQYRALVRRHDEAEKAFQDAYSRRKSPEEGLEIADRLGPKPNEEARQFFALAERYPDDPAAVDALGWIVEHAREGGIVGNPRATGREVARAMEILVRDHAGDPRLGPLCFKLTGYPTPGRDAFLAALAERSPDRAVRGQACLAYGQYLKQKREFVEEHRRSGDSSKEEDILPMFRGGYLAKLLAADSSDFLREADRQFARVLDEFGDLPHVDRSGLRRDEVTRETIADVARRQRPGIDVEPRRRFEALVAAFAEAEKAADRASQAAGGPVQGGFEAWVAAYPKWADQGRKIWELGRDHPRHPAGFDALLWIILRGALFFDAAEERAPALAGAVDLLIRERLDDIACDLGGREVAHAFNSSNPVPAPPLDRLFRALFEKAKAREARGRSGLLLARYLKNEAGLIEYLPRLGPNRARYEPAYLDRLQAKGRSALVEEAAAILERVIDEYGDVRYLNGMVLTDETLATVAGRDLDEIRSLAVGQAAPEIAGLDADGRPMTLSEFRGKVVVLDFGSHQNCGGCRLVYPKQRVLMERHKGRPFVVLGVNNNDRPETLKELAAKGEVTWRCWRDGDDPEGPGTITQRWNIRGYPTFIVLDHRGVIRFKDLSPLDSTFDPAIEALVKEAESPRP